MPRLNVRCCCQPTKILGTLEVPEGWQALKAINLRRYDGGLEVLEIREIVLGARSELVEKYSRVPLPALTERAVYSEDRPIEFWRKVPGFREGDAV